MLHFAREMVGTSDIFVSVSGLRIVLVVGRGRNSAERTVVERVRSAFEKGRTSLTRRRTSV